MKLQILSNKKIGDKVEGKASDIVCNGVGKNLSCPGFCCVTSIQGYLKIKKYSMQGCLLYAVAGSAMVSGCHKPEPSGPIVSVQRISPGEEKTLLAGGTTKFDVEVIARNSLKGSRVGLYSVR